MLIRTIEFEDFDGNIRKEEHCFHMSKAEIIKWLTTSGDYTLDRVLDRLAKERNGKKVMEIFEDLIRRSYGKKSLDGRRFMKSDEISREFMETEAYSILFTELVSDAKKAANFVNSIIPKDIAGTVLKTMKENPEGIPEEIRDYLPG